MAIKIKTIVLQKNTKKLGRKMAAANSQFKDSILSSSSILYLEDEDTIRKETSGILQKFFKNVYTAANGQEGLELYLKYQESIDIIITDLNMPKMDGISFMIQVRIKDKRIPILVSTAFSDTENIIKSIKLKVADYILKPMQLTTTLKIILNILSEINNIKLIKQQKNELESFQAVLDKQNLISKTNPEGIITQVNKLFCDVSDYTEDELLGFNRSIIRHPAVSSEFYKNIHDCINSKKIWRGKLKNITKEGSTFYTKTTIIPIFDLEGMLIEFIYIGFLITKEEEEKQTLKRYILKQKSKFLEDENSLETRLSSKLELAKKENSLQEIIKNEKINEFIVNIEAQLKTSRNRLIEEKARVLGLENKIKAIDERNYTLQASYKDRMIKLHKIMESANFKYEKSKKREMMLDDKLIKAQESIKVLQSISDNHLKRIEDLSSLIKIGS